MAYALALVGWRIASPLLDWLLAAASNLLLPSIDPQGLLEHVSVDGPNIDFVLRGATGRGESVIPFKGAAGHYGVTTYVALFLGATDLKLLAAGLRAAAVFPLLLLTQVLAIFFELEFEYAARGLAPMAPGTVQIFHWAKVFFSTMGVLFFPVLLWAAFGFFARPKEEKSGR